MKQMKNRKSNNGITLIALVITIILLLILAGVSIRAIGGENEFDLEKQEVTVNEN